MEIWREGQRVKVEWGGMVDSEKDVSKMSKGRGCGRRPTAPGLESPRGDPCCRSSAARVVRGVSGDPYRRCMSGPRYFDVLIFRLTKLHKSHE
jgi:hypothetical protein